MMVMISVLESALTVSPAAMSTETTVPLIGLFNVASLSDCCGVGEVGLGGVDGGLIRRDLLGRVGVASGGTGAACAGPVAPVPVAPVPVAPVTGAGRSGARCCRCRCSHHRGRGCPGWGRAGGSGRRGGAAG